MLKNICFTRCFSSNICLLLLPNLTSRRALARLRVTTQSKSKPCFEFDLTILNRFFLFPMGM